MRQLLQTASASLAYTDMGPKGGEGSVALVFLHYWGGSARTWDAVIARLAPQVRCIALDQRGWGGSSALDGRYGLDAMAQDVTALVGALDLRAFVLVGHSMGGKVAQMVAARGRPGLQGLVLVAPAPPVPMTVPAAGREAMLASYQSREGILEALKVLAGSSLSDAQVEQVVADTLAGHADAKRIWTTDGMLQDVSAGLEGIDLAVQVIVGDRDQVERAEALRAIFASRLPQASFTILDGVGHLSPLEAPGALAGACEAMLRTVAS